MTSVKLKETLDMCNLNNEEKAALLSKIDSKRKQKKHFNRYGTLVLATSIVMCVGIYAYFKPYSYISIDVNPSIELQLNMFDRVLTTKAVNIDAENILSEVKVNNQSVNQAINQIISKLEEKGYFKDNHNIVITTNSDNEKKAGKVLSEVEKVINKTISTKEKDITVISDVVSKEAIITAHKANTTPGKLGVIKKLEQYLSDTSLSEEELISMSINEILDYLLSTNSNELDLVFANIKENSKNDALLNKLELELEKYEKKHGIDIDVDLDTKDDEKYDKDHDIDDDYDDISKPNNGQSNNSNSNKDKDKFDDNDDKNDIDNDINDDLDDIFDDTDDDDGIKVNNGNSYDKNNKNNKYKDDDYKDKKDNKNDDFDFDDLDDHKGKDD